MQVTYWQLHWVLLTLTAQQACLQVRQLRPRLCLKLSGIHGALFFPFWKVRTGQIASLWLLFLSIGYMETRSDTDTYFCFMDINCWSHKTPGLMASVVLTPNWALCVHGSTLTPQHLSSGTNSIQSGLLVIYVAGFAVCKWTFLHICHSHYQWDGTVLAENILITPLLCLKCVIDDSCPRAFSVSM